MQSNSTVLKNDEGRLVTARPLRQRQEEKQRQRPRNKPINAGPIRGEAPETGSGQNTEEKQPNPEEKQPNTEEKQRLNTEEKQRRRMSTVHGTPYKCTRPITDEEDGPTTTPAWALVSVLAVLRS